MKLVAAADRMTYKSSDSTTAYEYDTSNDAINGAVIEINGRYPVTGWVLNTVSTSLVHVLEGSGTAVFDEATVDLGPDDQLLIEVNEKYVFEGDLNFIRCDAKVDA